MKPKRESYEETDMNKARLYHRDNLPMGVDEDTLHPWPSVYYGGSVEYPVPEHYQDAPDIILADTPLALVDDGWKLDVELVRVDGSVEQACAYIWTAGDLRYADGRYEIVNRCRRGRVVLATDEDGNRAADTLYQKGD